MRYFFVPLWGHPRRELPVAYVLLSRGQVLLQGIALHTLREQLLEVFWQPALCDVVVERQVAQNVVTAGPIRIVNGHWESTSSVLLFARDGELYEDFPLTTFLLGQAVDGYQPSRNMAARNRHSLRRGDESETTLREEIEKRNKIEGINGGVDREVRVDRDNGRRVHSQANTNSRHKSIPFQQIQSLASLHQSDKNQVWRTVLRIVNSWSECLDCITKGE